MACSQGGRQGLSEAGWEMGKEGERCERERSKKGGAKSLSIEESKEEREENK